MVEIRMIGRRDARFRVGTIMNPKEFLLSDLMSFTERGSLTIEGITLFGYGDGRIEVRTDDIVVYRPHRGISFVVNEPILFEWLWQTEDLVATAIDSEISQAA